MLRLFVHWHLPVLAAEIDDCVGFAPGNVGYFRLNLGHRSCYRNSVLVDLAQIEGNAVLCRSWFRDYNRRCSPGGIIMIWQTQNVPAYRSIFQ